MWYEQTELQIKSPLVARFMVEQTWQTCYLFRWQYMVKILIWVIYSKTQARICDCEVQQTSTPLRWLTATHSPQNIRFIRAEAMPEHNPHKQDNSAHSCNSTFSNRDGDKEAKLTNCSFKLVISNQTLKLDLPVKWQTLWRLASDVENQKHWRSLTSIL